VPAVVVSDTALRLKSLGLPFLQSYAAVKAATISMVKSMAMEVAPRGIKVKAVSSGDIEFERGVGAKLYCTMPSFLAKIRWDAWDD
jgi:NAD(P)-dependent dehydrogenase (short-subunit alcohol dehydrogenase family)